METHMVRNIPYKRPYDPAPYDALAAQLRSGADVQQAVADLIADTVTRPGFMTARLNLASIPAPDGSPWCWLMVDDIKRRVRAKRSQRSWDAYSERVAATLAKGSAPPVAIRRDHENHGNEDGETLLPDAVQAAIRQVEMI
jgi:hypothetical protein